VTGSHHRHVPGASLTDFILGEEIMNKDNGWSGVTSIIGMLALLSLGRGSDAFIYNLMRSNSQTFGLPYGIMWSYIISDILFAALVIFLAWLVLSWLPREIWISIVFVFIGLFVVVSPILYFTPPFGNLPAALRSLLFPASGSVAFTYSSGGFVAAIGLFALILPKK
jgi:hypothetical protein